MTDTNNETQKNEVAEENKKATDEAHRLATEQEERDRLAGKQPIIPTVAESIKKKLEKNEFSVAVDEQGRHVPARPPKE